MARITLFPVNSRLTHQKGIAALLLVLLTGLSATFIAMGTMAYVRGTQKTQRTVHAQTQAEINAWAGVQALTNFLDTGANLSASFDTLGILSFSRTSNNGATLATAAYQSGCSSTDASTNTINACFDVTGTSAQSNVTLRVNYRITQTGATPPSMSISNPMVFNGSLLVTGGGLDVTGHKDLKNITVNGDLKVTSAAESDVSGCATGDISIDGGGIASDGYLHSSGGDITITGQGDKNAAIWGENVTITGGGGGYKSIKANGNIVSTNAGDLVVDFMHANNITTKPGGKFLEVKVNNDYTLGNATGVFDTLTGGGDFYIVDEHHLPVVNNTSVIAGMVRIGDPSANDFTGGVAYTDSVSNLLTNQLGTHPGLPGLPKCEVKVTAFDVNDMIDEANYIFYFDEKSKHPMLKVQNVNDRNGNSIEQTFDLKNDDIRTLNGSDFIKCGWDNDHCVNQWGSPDPNDGWYFNGLFSFPTGIVVFGGVGEPEDNNLSGTKFTLDGIPGEDSASPLGKRPLYNSLLSTGTIDLTQGGSSKKVTAPYFAGAAAVCDQDFYPTQLCQKKEDGSGFEFKTTVNEEGEVTKSHPLANNAIVVNKNLDISGWALTGHVVIGEELTNDSNETTIEGGLMVGLNLSEDEPEGESMVTAGGLVANIDGLAAEQLLTGIEGTSTGAGGGTGGTQRTLSGYQVVPL